MNHKKENTSNQNGVVQLFILSLFVISTFTQELVNSDYNLLVRSEKVTSLQYPNTVYPNTDYVGFSLKRYEGSLNSFENNSFSDVELRPFHSTEFNLPDYRFFIKE